VDVPPRSKSTEKIFFKGARAQKKKRKRKGRGGKGDLRPRTIREMYPKEAELCSGIKKASEGEAHEVFSFVRRNRKHREKSKEK